METIPLSQPIPITTNQNSLLRKINPWILAITLWGSLLCTACMVTPPQVWVHIQHILFRYALGSSYVVVKNQPLEDTFVVSKMKLPKPGFAALILSDFYDSPGSNLSAFSSYLPAGEYINVPIQFSLEDSYANIDPRIWKPGQKAFIALYSDDGDNILNISQDTIVQLPDGEPVVASFTILP